ncbi:MAG: hypothetical protein AWM53_01988 [Candidatus Dichloromethanomonas elyunquensis]|nr:MAG: hypothetical protein AWM53_01988 [Candidatus Dichloromethanomonas elyunquensis]
MSKQEEFQKERLRWDELFAKTDDQTQKAADGLIQKAAFLNSMCWELEQVIETSGAIKVHPQHPELQKQIPAVKEYARLSESYANIVNKLNVLRLKTTVEDDDELGEFE